MKTASVFVSVVVLSQVFISTCYSADYQVGIFAGRAGSFGTADGPAEEARFGAVSDVAVDKDDNIYVADYGNSTIRKITPDGIVSTVAGIAEERGFADGPGTEAQFDLLRGVAVDGEGIVYVADWGNHVIRKIDPDGIVSTLAGMPGVSGEADGQGNEARFFRPISVEVDAGNNIYVADQGNGRVCKITPDGMVITLANIGTPEGLAIDSEGNVYVGTWGSSNSENIRVIRPEGTVEDFAGRVGRPSNPLTYDGPIDACIFNDPTGIAIDIEGNIYVADTVSRTIRYIDVVEGIVSTVAGVRYETGSIDGVGPEARFGTPVGIAVDSSGNLIVADRFNLTVRKVTPEGEVTTIAGLASGSEDGPALEARFDSPHGIDVSKDGRVFVADWQNHTLRVIENGVVSTLAGSPGVDSAFFEETPEDVLFSYPRDVAVDDAGNAYILDGSRIRKVSSEGIVETLAGNESSGSEDGIGTEAQFRRPQGITMGTDGNLYVADSSNHLIRRVTLDGVVSTVAGIARQAGNDDGTAFEATFNYPQQIVQDNAGDIYFTSSQMHSVRKISTDGTVTTLAGVAEESGTVDGIGTEARFDTPRGIAVDKQGYLLVAEYFGGPIRRISPDGEVTTLIVADSEGNTDIFLGLWGLAVDDDGLVYLSDIRQNAIYVAELIGTENPKLQILKIESGISLSWPNSETGFVLESGVQNGTGFEWSVISDGITQQNDDFFFESEAEGDQMLFRLRK